MRILNAFSCLLSSSGNLVPGASFSASYRGCAFFVYSGMNRRYTLTNPRKDWSCVNVADGLACLNDLLRLRQPLSCLGGQCGQ
eukprot:IDg22970t1